MIRSISFDSILFEEVLLSFDVNGQNLTVFDKGQICYLLRTLISFLAGMPISYNFTR